MPSSDFGSVRSCRPRPRTSEVKSFSAALVYNSRLRGVSTFLSSDSESTQNLGSIGNLMDLSDVRVPSYGSVSDFRLEIDQIPMGLTACSPRKSKTEL